jgi:protein-tyrosine-phosphatase
VPRKAAVLFVCLGNICRSPLAEAAFRAEVVRIGLDIEVDSAGTGDWRLGKPPDRCAQAVANRYGIDISFYSARQVTRQDFQRFSHIVALDLQTLAALEAMRPPTAAPNSACCSITSKDARVRPSLIPIMARRPDSKDREPHALGVVFTIEFLAPCKERLHTRHCSPSLRQSIPSRSPIRPTCFSGPVKPGVAIGLDSVSISWRISISSGGSRDRGANDRAEDAACDGWTKIILVLGVVLLPVVMRVPVVMRARGRRDA